MIVSIIEIVVGRAISSAFFELITGDAEAWRSGNLSGKHRREKSVFHTTAVPI